MSTAAVADPAPPARASLGRQLLEGVLWVLTVPVLVAAAVGLGASFVDPRTLWWPQVVAVVLPYIGFGMAGALVIALAIRQRRVALALTIPLLLLLVRTEPWARLGADPAGETLHLTTFNVPNILEHGAMRDSMQRFLSRERPHLVPVQDAYVRGPRPNRNRDQWQSPQLRGVDEIGYTVETPLVLPGVGGWRRDATGVPLLVLEGMRVEEQEALVIADPDDTKASQAIRSVIVWEGRRFVLYNVHLRSFGDAKPWLSPDFELRSPRTWPRSLAGLDAIYTARAADVERIEAAIARETLPVVVAGDLNSTPDNWSYRRLRNAGGVKRQDAYREAGASVWGRTYHARTLIVRIDHVLVDPALAVLFAEVRNVGFSDHRPVLTGLRWREEDANSAP